MVISPHLRKYVLNKYLACNKTKLKLVCFTPSSINWKRKSIIGLYRTKSTWEISRLPLPQVIYNRCYNLKDTTIKRLALVVGRNKCFNQINQFNKLEMYNHLSQLLVQYLPETIPYDRENALRLLEIHKTLYLKPCYGHYGNNMYRVEMKNSGDIHICRHYFTPELIERDPLIFQEKIHNLIGPTPYIIQKGVDMSQLNEQNFDIRALVQKNIKGVWAVTNVVSRISYKGCFNTSIFENICLTEELLNRLYPPNKTKVIIQSINKIALKAAKTIEAAITNNHLGELSVDFALDKEGLVWVIEINGMPQKNLYDEIHKNGRSVYIQPLQYAQYLYQH